MSKRKMILMATGLSAVVLVSSSIINIPNSNNESHVQVVQADGALDSWMPDPGLQQYIADKWFNGDVSKITKTSLDEKVTGRVTISGTGISSIEGIENATKMDDLTITSTKVSDLSPLVTSNVTKLYLGSNEITNFAALQEMPLLKEAYPHGEHVVNEQSVNLTDDSMTVDVSTYFGNYPALSVKVESVENNGKSIFDFSYDDATRILGLSDLDNSVIEGDGSYRGDLKIQLLQSFKVNGIKKEIKLVINQPYTISVDPVESIRVMTDRGQLNIYDKNGTLIAVKNLSGVTNYNINQRKNIGGDVYYQIGDNQWIKASDVNEFYSAPATIQTHHGTNTTLNTLSGTIVKNRALKANSNWYASGYVMIDGQKYYRVSTNEWIQEDHGVKYEAMSGVVTANETAQLYSSKGKKSHRALMRGAKFVTDKIGTVNGETMYRVASDEWVPEGLVSLD